MEHSMADSTPPSPSLGLCAYCQYQRELVSAKGSRFSYCQRAETDSSYPKYPRLPVQQCPGYEARPQSQTRS